MLALATALLTLATPTAQAGGIGVLATGGFRGETLYFYDRSDDFTKYQIGETIGNFGGGIEVMLGDRDDRIVGHFRGYYMAETPEYNPANVTSLVAPADVVAAWRQDIRHVGMVTVGLQFGLFGDPDRVQLVAVADIGSGFLTNDHSEFLIAEVGPGITIGFPGSEGFMRDTQFWANGVFALRQDRGFKYGANVYTGLRYMFD